MTPGAWARLVPPVVLGAALSLSSMVAAGLLLYGGPGFLRALSVLLACILGALAAGVAAGLAGEEGEPIETLRRRWLLLLVSFTLAAVFSALWEGFRGFGALAVTQAVGLALLAGVPLFAGGTVLGTLARIRELPSGVRGPGPLSLAGGAGGAVLLGFVLFPALSPTAVLLSCLVALSATALLQGRLLDEVVWVHRGGADSGSAGQGSSGRFRMERWTRARPHASRRAFIVADRLRLLAGDDAAPVLAADRAIQQGLPHWCPAGARGAVIGGGGGLVARRLVLGAQENGGGGAVLFEEDEEFVTALGAHLLESEGSGAVRIRSVCAWDVLGGSPVHLPPKAFDLLYVDTLALAPAPGEFRLPPGGLVRMRDALRPGGVLIVSPLQDGGSAGSLLAGARLFTTHFARVSLYVAGRSDSGDPSEVPRTRLAEWRRSAPESGSRPAFLVAARGRTAASFEGGWPDRLDSHLRVVLEEREELEA